MKKLMKKVGKALGMGGKNKDYDMKEKIVVTKKSKTEDMAPRKKSKASKSKSAKGKKERMK